MFPQLDAAILASPRKWAEGLLQQDMSASGVAASDAVRETAEALRSEAADVSAPAFMSFVERLAAGELSVNDDGEVCASAN